MNPQEQAHIKTAADEISDDIELGKRVVQTYRTQGRNAALAMLPEVLKEAQEDFAALTAVAPVIKSGWRTTEFWLVALFALGNVVFTAWKGVALPLEVNIAIGAVIAAYTATRAVVKAKAAPKALPVIKSLLFALFVPFLLFTSGCAHFSTTQTDTSYEHGQISRSITTEASATTVAASKSALAQWKASQTDKTQGASVGSLTQESDAEKLLRAAIDQAVKSATPIP